MCQAQKAALLQSWLALCSVQPPQGTAPPSTGRGPHGVEHFAAFWPHSPKPAVPTDAPMAVDHLRRRAEEIVTGTSRLTLRGRFVRT